LLLEYIEQHKITMIHGSTFNSQFTHPSGSVVEKYPLLEYSSRNIQRIRHLEFKVERFKCLIQIKKKKTLGVFKCIK